VQQTLLTPLEETAPIRFVFQRLASLGLFSHRPTSLHSPSPSIPPALLPRLLSHLHPPVDSPIPPYPASFLPSIFLPLPSSTLASVTASLLQHLVYHLPAPSAPILPNRPDSRVKRSVEVLTRIIGPPEIGGEAWEAVIMAMINGKRNGSAMDEREHALTRMAVAWVGTGGEKGGRVDVRLESC
jgi:telomere length regulation protein